MRISIEVEPAVAQLFGEDGPGRARARRLTQLLERFAYVLERAAAPAFTAAEWELMLEAYAGTVAEPACVIDEFVLIIEEPAKVWDLGRTHGVDVCALVARLRRLDTVQTVALVERLERERDERWAARDDGRGQGGGLSAALRPRHEGRADGGPGRRRLRPAREPSPALPRCHPSGGSSTDCKRLVREPSRTP